MKKFFLFVLLLVLLAVGGVVAMVMISFNPSAYEKQVVSYVQKLTGREVVIGGPITIDWNPVPKITIQNLRIGNIDQSQEKTMVSVDKAQITLAWASLLKSPLEIKKIELSNPTLLLERLESNRANFIFPFLMDPNFQMQEINFETSNTPSNALQIESIQINNGSIRYVNKITNVSFDISDINGKLGVDSIRGPFRLTADGLINNKKINIAVDTGKFQVTAPIPVNLNLSEPSSKTTFALKNGEFTPARADKWYEGSGNFSIEHLNAFTDIFGLPPFKAKDTSANGSLTFILSPTTDILKDFTVTFGNDEQPMAITGTIERDYQAGKSHYKANLGTNVWQVAEISSYADKIGWDWLKDATDRPSIDFELAAQTVSLKDQKIQDLKMSGSYKDGVLTLDKSTATLPGNTSFTFSGKGQLVNGTPTLDLGVQSETLKLAEAISWFLPKASEFPYLKEVKKAVWNGRLSLTPDQIGFDFKELKLDDARVSGSIQTMLGDRLVLWTKLALTNINLDNYLNWKPSETPIALSNLPLIVKNSLEKAAWTNEAIIRGSFDLVDTTLFNLPASKIHVEGSLADNILKLDNIIAQNWASADLTTDAVINGVGRPQLNVDKFNLALETKQLPLLLKRINLTSDLPLIQQSTNTSFKLGLKGGRTGSWDVDSQSVISDAVIKLAGTLETPETTLSLKNLNFDITHPKFQTFLKLITPQATLFPKLDGAFKAKGKLSGSASHIAATDTTIGVGLQQVMGSIAFDQQNIKNLTANLTSPSLDLNRFLVENNALYSQVGGFSKKAFDFSGWDNWEGNITLNAAQLLFRDINIRQADVEVSLGDKVLTLAKLTGLTGTSDKSPISINGKLDWSSTPKLISNFDIQNIPLRSDFMVLPDFSYGNGNVSIKGDIKTQGASLSDFVSELNGQGSLTIKGGQMIGVDIQQLVSVITRAIQKTETAQVFEPEFKRVLNSGKTALQSLTGNYAIANGIVRMMDGTLLTAQANANPTQIVWNIPKRTFDVSIPVTLTPLDNLPPVILGISIGAGKGKYQANFSDLSASLSNTAQYIIDDAKKQEQKATEQAIAQKRSDRIAQATTLTVQARQAVSKMEEDLQRYPFEKGSRLLQSARDALSIVNQVAVLEEPTDAQLIQEIEQARLVLLKAEEFGAALKQDTQFNHQQQIQKIQDEANKRVKSLESWALDHPDIAILTKLADNAKQNMDIIRQLSLKLTSQSSQAENEQILADCADALTRIDKAYQHAARFDLSGSSSEPILTDTEKKPVKGSFNRS